MSTQTPLPPVSRTTPQPTRASSPSTPRRGRRWLLWIFLVLVAGAVGYAIFVRPFQQPADGGRGGRGGRGARDNRPMPVTAVPARTSDLEVKTAALGTVTPVNTVTVRSRVDGELQKIFFTEGTRVKAGEPLAEIDPRPFEVQKLQSEAQLAKDKALLDNSRVDLDRFKALLEQDSVAKQQVDTQAAQVAQNEAAVKQDEAQIASSTLQLTYAHVTAPISGRIGLRFVDQGNIVHASDANGLAVIIQLQPMTVLFSIPQDDVPQVMKHFATGEPMTVQAFNRDGQTLLATGKLVTVDNQIDPTTGTVKLRAEFPNTDEMLFPNQFVNIQLFVEQLKGVTVVPTAAVQRGLSGLFVYVVAADNTVSVHPVETGPSDKGVIVVTKGIKPGDVVVVDGVDKLREGSQVELITPSDGKSPAEAAPAKEAPPAGKRGRKGARPAQN
jgi:multidrug efflux system membrane fusion protein